MNAKGFFSSGAIHLSNRRFLPAVLLAMFCALLTGCPHNDYTVELKPDANGVERTLTFYQADGSNSNGVPNYQTFATNELAAITRVYPAGAVMPDGLRYVATGEFSGALPADVGGSGSYTNFATSLGEAGFYLERFRGNDDLAGRTEKSFRAADQITDLIIGWTQPEFGRERGYPKLRQFLDDDFRRDLKNAGLYFWVGQISALSNTNAQEEFSARLGQYLHERGYVKLSDVPEISRIATSDGTNAAVPLLHLIQRLAMEKMGQPASDPPPKSLAVLADPAALEQSWTQYLAGTDLYRDKIKEWEMKTNTDPGLKKPAPDELAGDLLDNLLTPFKLFAGRADHLTVKLALSHPPNHTNGRWQDGQVIWEATLDETRPLPVLCYASWSDPQVEFQTSHFGQVILDGDELTEYCLWRNTLNAKQAGEWETILAGLHTGQKFRDQLETFRRSLQSAGGQDSQNPTPAPSPGTNSTSK